MSDTIQNKIIQIFAHKIPHSICGEAKRSLFFELQLTQTFDVSVYKQFSCSLQFVNASLVQHKVFLGFYTDLNSKLQTLLLSIKDLLTMQNLPLSKLQGYCFD